MQSLRGALVEFRTSVSNSYQIAPIGTAGIRNHFRAAPERFRDCTDRSANPAPVTTEATDARFARTTPQRSHEVADDDENVLGKPSRPHSPSAVHCPGTDRHLPRRADHPESAHPAPIFGEQAH